jgi:hypothetical protein
MSGRLQAGRPDSGLINRGVRAPHTHPQVASAVNSFTSFAQDQYQDAVALSAALSVLLKETAARYLGIELETDQRMQKFLRDSTLQPFYLRNP